MADGKILQVIGPMVDVVFPERETPERREEARDGNGFLERCS